MWWIYALLSAFFAALTAIFAKVGIKELDTDLASAIKTAVVLILIVRHLSAFSKQVVQGTTSILKYKVSLR